MTAPSKLLLLYCSAMAVNPQSPEVIGKKVIASSLVLGLGGGRGLKN